MKVFIEINNFPMKVMNTIINQECSPNKVTNSELNEMKQQKEQSNRGLMVPYSGKQGNKLHCTKNEVFRQELLQ